MLNYCKEYGVIIAIKKNNVNSVSCLVLFSDSVVRRVLILSKNKILTLGHSVFGYLYRYNDRMFFKVESLDFFIGAIFLFDEKILKNILSLINIVENTVPENLQITYLYEKFIITAKEIISDNKDAYITFKNWIELSLN